MKGINTKPSLIIDSTFVLYFNEIEIGLIIATKTYFQCYVLGKRFKVVKSDKNKLKSILHDKYVEYVKQLAESLGENLVFTKVIGENKAVQREGWKILS
jgi:hypothetical protein